MAPFTRTFKPTTIRPKFQMEASPNLLGFLKDSFRLQTILALGAVLQATLLLILPIRIALAPATLYLLLRITRISLQANSMLPAPEYTANVVPGKVSAQLPAPPSAVAAAAEDSTPAAHPVVVFMLGARFNHPLGAFSPGAKELTAHFQAMQADLQARAHEYGLLGASSWLGNEASDSNTIMTLYYFRSMAQLNKFAHDPIHRAGWDWYRQARHAHVGIMHEAFAVPAGAYESIYVNFPPTMMGATAGLVEVDKEGQAEWVRSLVPANKGVLRSQFGRMARSQGLEHDKIGEEVVWEREQEQMA